MEMAVGREVGMAVEVEETAVGMAVENGGIGGGNCWERHGECWQQWRWERRWEWRWRAEGMAVGMGVASSGNDGGERCYAVDIAVEKAWGIAVGTVVGMAQR